MGECRGISLSPINSIKKQFPGLLPVQRKLRSPTPGDCVRSWLVKEDPMCRVLQPKSKIFYKKAVSQGPAVPRLLQSRTSSTVLIFK